MTSCKKVDLFECPDIFLCASFSLLVGIAYCNHRKCQKLFMLLTSGLFYHQTDYNNRQLSLLWTCF